MAAQGYIGRAPGESSVIVARQTFTPTGITTNFTFASGYTVGYVDAYLNGARLIEGDDYTATDGSVVGLTTHAINGDVLELVVYKAFNVANVTAATADFSVGGDLSVTGNTDLTGTLTVGGVEVQPGAAGTWATFTSGGEVGISTTKKVKIENGLEVTGISTFSGALTVGGVLTYDDVTNVDSIGIITARSHVSIADSILHTGDTDTSIRFPSANTFTVETGGTKRFEVDSNGDVILGFAGNSLYFQNGFNNSNSRIQNGGATNNSNLKFYTRSSGTEAERVRITSAGLVGIGSQSPAQALDIMSANPVIRLTDTDPAGVFSQIDGAGGDLILSADGGAGSSGSFISLRVDGTDASAEALRITSDGDVGIGEASPADRLVVQETNASGDVAVRIKNDTLTDGSATNPTTASLYLNTSTGDFNSFYIQARRTDNDTHFGYANPRDGGHIPSMVITNDRQVAIGTATIYANANCDDLIVGNRNSNEQGITIGSANQGQIAFADLAGDRQGLIHYQHTDDSMRFMTNGATNERVRIRSDGLVGVATAVPEAQLTVKGDGDIAAKDFKYSYSNTHGIQIKGNESALDIVSSDNGSHGGSILLRTSTDGYGMHFNPTKDQLIFHYTVPSANDFSIHDGNNTSTNTEVLTIGKTGICTATQFDATSDVSLKENIEVIDEPIIKLSELKGVTFDWKAGGHSVGVIAQDVEKVLPTAVGGSEDRKTVNYNAIIGLLVESVKDQQKQIEELKSLLDK